MTLTVTKIIPHINRESAWQAVLDLDLRPTQTHIVTIQSGNTQLTDEVALKKIVIIQISALRTLNQRFLLITTDFEKNKSITELRGVHIRQDQFFKIISENIADADVQVVYSNLDYEIAGAINKPDHWSLLALYDDEVKNYYSALHQGLSHTLQKQLLHFPHHQSLDLIELGCGLGEALQHALKQLPDHYQCRATGIDIDPHNVAEATKRASNATYIQDDFFKIINGTSIFDRIYKDRPSTELRVLISSGGLSNATIPRSSDFFWFLLEAAKHHVDLMIIASVVEIPLHSPWMKKIGYSVTPERLLGFPKSPIYIIKRRAEFSLHRNLVPLTQENQLHLNLQFCLDPLRQLTQLSESERNKVISIDLSYCELSNDVVTRLDPLLVCMPNLRIVLHRQLTGNINYRCNITPDLAMMPVRPWQWHFLAPSSHHAIYPYLLSRKHIYEKSLIYSGISTGIDLLPNANDNECQAILSAHRQQHPNFTLTDFRNTLYPDNLELLMQAAPQNTALYLILLARWNTGYYSQRFLDMQKNASKNTSGYAGTGDFAPDFDFVKELNCYKQMQQRGFFSKSLFKVVCQIRLRELDQELMKATSPTREKNEVHEQRLDAAIALYQSLTF